MKIGPCRPCRGPVCSRMRTPMALSPAAAPVSRMHACGFTGGAVLVVRFWVDAVPDRIQTHVRITPRTPCSQDGFSSVAHPLAAFLASLNSPHNRLLQQTIIALIAGPWVGWPHPVQATPSLGLGLFQTGLTARPPARSGAVPTHVRPQSSWPSSSSDTSTRNPFTSQGKISVALARAAFSTSLNHSTNLSRTSLPKSVNS